MVVNYPNARAQPEGEGCFLLVFVFIIIIAWGGV